ncbi:P97 family adhesin [Mesomycoplasma dispar]|uniref:P97 family adhesin n=1 Tax=Mesomycoplasma dispar TaxID=86660 RepID=UPI0018E0BBED|nr:adhesin [Mesomycoplasma dispar]
MVKKKNLIAGVSTGVVGVILFATTIGLVTRIRYTGENPRAELENLVSRVKNVAFKSDVFDNSATYKEIKAKLFDENGKLLPGIDLNKFISFYTTYNSKIRKFDVSFTPNKPFFEFINLIPNDEDQSFELQFRAKHQLDNNYTAYSTILSKKITFAQRSQFALADFNANLEKITESFKQNIQNLRKKDLTRNFASQNISIVSQKIPSLTRVEDFASDINKSGTQEEAVEKISQYFPDFQKIIYELNDDRNNNLPFRKGKIFNFSLERHTGTNDFIALNANSDPSFLVKAELTNEAKFELKGLNIQQVQMLEKIDLVPTTEKTNTDSTNNQQQETEKTPGQTEQTEADKENKDSKTEAKKASYFANLDDILAKISIRKLTFTDFKVAPGDTTEASPPAAAQTASQTSVQEETRVLSQVASTTQFQEQVQENGSGSSQSSGAESSAPSGGSGSSGAPQSSGTTENETNQEPPAAPKEKDAETKIEELAKKLTVNTKTANEFLDTLNEKLYSSKRGRAKAVAEKINEELLIKPLSLDFGELKQYFPETNPQGVEFSLDITNAKVNKTKLEIPVDINLYSSFFGDSSNKFLKSRKDKLEIPWFKAESGSTGENQEQKQELDKKRKEFFFVNSLPENSPEIKAVAVNVDAQATVVEKKREEKIVSTTGYISKAELEKLIQDNSHQEIKDILSNRFQYGYDFKPTDSMLNAWVGKQKFPSLADLAEFKENKEVESEYKKVKSLNSDKFFATESDVAAFYAHLVNLEPAEVLQYLFEIAKSANLISESQKLDLKNVSEGDVFNAASSIEFNKSSDVYGLDFNGHIKSFEKRGWFSNLFLPKKIAENFTKKETDSEIFKKINTIKEAKIPEESGSGTSSTGTGGVAGNQSENDLYKDIREAAKKIKESLKKSRSDTILSLTSSGSGSQEQSSPPAPISESVKKFYTDSAHKLSNLKDLMLAFYVKAKELNNFRPWAKISEDLDYQLVFEKQENKPNHDSDGLDVPSDAENYKLTYYYKITDKNSKKEEYSSPKTTLTLLVQKEGSFKNTKEKNKLNEAILRIPPSYSVIQLEKEEFDKLKIEEESSSSNKKAFEERKEFKEIQEIIKKFDPKLKVSVKSEKKDSFNPEKVKIILLQVSSGGEATDSSDTNTDSEKKSSLKFQIRVELIEQKATKPRYDAQKELQEELKKRLGMLIEQRPGLPGPPGPLPLSTLLASASKIGI